ncbi:exodeoxyribonuclease III [Liquorilactobacillus nagelii]|jgi:exodeoxyribonuclease-3|uniref:exodeoxyribonuclease III n=1 Tax=Liquorilactobacillus nagelii TaxID=82688 RepID=UPI0024331824|nr:exodeoxyribonuclease III [Liquorilactobacillus nagelii]MCI1699972.1 exodeoxyribonuclease III [Liquorilactobacillus nagelii]
MKFISWNVNGLRAILKKDFSTTFNQLDADFFCLQEIKLQQDQIDLNFPGYTAYWNYAERKGYSGTAIFAKLPASSVRYGIGIDEFDHEGRVITLEYPNFFLVTCYTPNSQQKLKRLNFRMSWEKAFRKFLQDLDQIKPVILCGDLNVAHQEIDLKNWKTNRHNAGFSDEERSAMTNLLGNGFIDTFRELHPETTGVYSWWSYRFHARENNAGWRIDYFITSKRLKPQIKTAEILTDILGSDHCPVGLILLDEKEKK